MKINEDFLARMREATQLLQTSGPRAATAAIQRALHGDVTPMTPQPDDAAHLPQPEVLRDINPPPVHDADPGSQPDVGMLARVRNLARGKWSSASDRQPIEDVEVDVAGKGKFLSGTCTNYAGTRAYKLYVPSGYAGEPLPLVVMLHGCKQHPNDFAAGTNMNMVAEENNCFVVYPAQMKAANGSNCWNWFKADDQRRDQGEPSIIADITRQIIDAYKIDTGRVYIAGLSAGGAMAAVMGATYPEIYAAVGIHSGLPYGAAHDVPSAFAAMKNGKAQAGPHNASAQTPASLGQPIPVIVFHGDRDTTVHPRNGDRVLAQYVPQAVNSASAEYKDKNSEVKVEKGTVPNGRAYTRTIRHDAQGKALAEQWIVHGAGHAWSGGSSSGSYTDAKGPNASREMLRFFYTHGRNAT